MTTQVSLYIEDTEIKVLVTKGKSIIKWASLLLEPGLVSDGIVNNEEQVAVKIKELFNLQGIKERRVVAALSGLHSVFRVLSLPDLPRSILAEAIKNEASRVVPFPLDQVYISYQVLPSPPGETNVFLVAYPRNATDALASTIKKAGLSLSLLDIAPLALCRCVDTPRSIIVNSWLSNVDIAIVSERIPQVIRSISLPIESSSLEEKMPNITEEFNRTISFYNSSYPEKKLDSDVPVFVCGDLGREPKSWPILIGEHRFKVSSIPTPLEAPESFVSCPFIVNIGLSLKEYLLPTIDGNFSIVNLNAIPEVHRPQKVSAFNILAPIIAIALIGGLVYGWFYVQDLQKETDDLNTQLTNINIEIAQKLPQIASLTNQVNQVGASIQPVNNTITKLENQLYNLTLGRENIVEDLRKAMVLQPGDKDLILTQLSHDGASFIASGLAINEDDIFEYARELRRTGRFSQIIISSISKVEINPVEEGGTVTILYAFTLTLV